jgi:hypothetical protein
MVASPPPPVGVIALIPAGVSPGHVNGRNAGRAAKALVFVTACTLFLVQEMVRTG